MRLKSDRSVIFDGIMANQQVLNYNFTAGHQFVRKPFKGDNPPHTHNFQEFLCWYSGNPNDPEAYACIQSYSPYDNVEAKDYPHLLVTAGLHDPRVAYWEPAKWVARLRARKTDANRLLLRTNMAAGHGGASGRWDFLREVAFRYAFVLDVLGGLESRVASREL
jgi:protease II